MKGPATGPHQNRTDCDKAILPHAASGKDMYLAWIADKESAIWDELYDALCSWIAIESGFSIAVADLEVADEDKRQKSEFYGLDKTGLNRGRYQYSAGRSKGDEGIPSLHCTLNLDWKAYVTWSSRDTLKDLWENHKAEKRGQRDAEYERRRAEREAERQAWAEKREREREQAAERRRQREAQRELDRAAFIKAAVAQYRAQADGPLGTYFIKKGLEGAPIKGARQSVHKTRGARTTLPFIDPLTGDVVGLEHFYETPYKTASGKLTNKEFAWGSRIEGAVIPLNGLPPANPVCVGITESASTGAAALLGLPRNHYVAAAGSANNLEAAFKALRQGRRAKGGFYIIADNDAKKAREIDPRTGLNKANTGLEKAHHLALKYKLDVVQPQLSAEDIAAGASDFADVLDRHGSEELKRQLSDFRPADPMWAFPRSRGKAVRRSARLFKRLGCEVTVKPEGRLGSMDFADGVTMMGPPKSAGKTWTCADYTSRNPDESVLVVSYLRTLVADLTGRFDMAHYEKWRGENRSVFCVNSLPNRFRGGKLEPVDTLIIDEIESFLRRLCSTDDFTNKLLCLEALEFYVRHAKKVIVMDANISEVTYNWLRRLRPADEKFRVVLSKTLPGLGKRIYKYSRAGDVRAALIAAIKAGRRCYYTLDSLNKAGEVELLVKELLELFPHLRILPISSKTVGNDDVKAFCANPTKQCKNYDVVIATPSVKTGLSIDSDWLDWVGGEYNAQIGTPYDAAQALVRVRPARELHVYIAHRGPQRPTDPEVIRARYLAEPGDDIQMFGMDALTGLLGVRHENYEALLDDVRRFEAKAANSYAYIFWRLMVEDGWDVVEGVGSPEAEALEKRGRVLDDARYEAEMLSRRALPLDEKRGLRAAKTYRDLTTDEELDLERTNLADDLCLNDDVSDQELTDLIRLNGHRRGTLVKSIERLELAVATPETQLRRLERQNLHGDTPAGDVRRVDQTAPYLRGLLCIAGIDPANGLQLDPSVSYTKESLRRDFVPLADRYRTKGVPGIPEHAKLWSNPTHHFGKALRSMGIEHKRRGRNAAGEYAVVEASLEQQKRWLAKRQTLPGQANNMGTLPALNTGFKAESVPYQPQHLLPPANLYPLGRDAAYFLERALAYLDKHTEPVNPADLRDRALVELAQTYPEADQAEVYVHWHIRLLDGAARDAATDADLRRDSLALLGWARTRWVLSGRAEPALAACASWGRPEWIAFADAALEAHRHPVPPGPSPTYYASGAA